MNKITKGKANSLKSAKTVLFLMVFLLCSVVTFGQFKINPNTTFTAKTVVSSKEEVNVLDASILGNNEFVLNGENQELETAAATSLPTLRIANASQLTIHTELKLRGNLVVQSGVLHLQKPIVVEGEVILKNDAVIPNQHLIIYKNKYVFHKEVTIPGTFEGATTSSAAIINSDELLFVGMVTELKPIIISNDFIHNQYNAMPFSPPPENRVHA